MTMKSKKAKRPDVEFDDDTDDSDDDALEIFRYNLSRYFLPQFRSAVPVRYWVTFDRM